MHPVAYAVLLAGLAAALALPFAHAQPDQLPFVTTWKTDIADQTIAFRLEGDGLTIVWGDGASSNANGWQLVYHKYANPGIHTVSIYGNIESISLGDRLNALNLMSIEQWGDTSWDRMVYAGASNMVYRATDTPDLSRVTDMSSMFWGATSFNGDISAWDVSSVTDMSQMFYSDATMLFLIKDVSANI